MVTDGDEGPAVASCQSGLGTLYPRHLSPGPCTQQGVGWISEALVGAGGWDCATLSQVGISGVLPLLQEDQGLGNVCLQQGPLHRVTLPCFLPSSLLSAFLSPFSHPLHYPSKNSCFYQ